MRKQKLRRSQHHFLENRHSSSLGPQTIVVALPPDAPRDFDLLSWSINMAARSKDAVTAFKHRDPGEGAHESSQKSNPCGYMNHESLCVKFKPLQDLCDAKQVHMRFKEVMASKNTTDKLLVEEVSASKANLLVVTISAQHSLRHAQRRGSFLYRQIPKGCSVVVVRDYKVLFYKENPSTVDEDESSTTHLKGKGNEASTEQHDMIHPIVTYGKAQWRIGGPCSPEGVLDSSQVLTDSDESLTPNDHIARTSCSSRKSLFSSAVSSSFWDDADDDSILKHSPSYLREYMSSSGSRLDTHPSAKLSRNSSLHRIVPRHSLRSRIHSLFSFLRPKLLDRKMIRAVTTKERWENFTYEEIFEATNHFSPDNLVGKGGHSEVYKGSIGGRLVAVKRLIQSNSTEQTTAEFLSEIGVICQTSHPNVAPLIGFCIDHGFFLVFDFFERGSLDSWLHGKNSGGGKDPILKWETRYKIAIGVARGLTYLHSECPRHIIHRDIKSSNILLAQDFEPLISDFGLSKWLPQPNSQIMAPVEGTFGYLAPEYVTNGIVDEKTDVFAFGVLLLELITGCMPIESLHPSLVLWARPFLETMNAEKLIDNRLHGMFNPQEVQNLMMAAALCTQQSPHCRPCMTQVLHMLTDDMAAPDGLDSISVFSSQSLCHQDSLFDSDYTSSSDYHDDLRRHREIAFEF